MLEDVFPYLNGENIKGILAAGFDLSDFSLGELAIVLNAKFKLTELAAGFKVTREIKDILDGLDEDFGGYICDAKVDALHDHLLAYGTMPELDVLNEGRVMLPSIFYEVAVRLFQKTFSSEGGRFFDYDEDHGIGNQYYFPTVTDGCLAVLICNIQGQGYDTVLAPSDYVYDMFARLMNPKDAMESYLTDLDGRELRGRLRAVDRFPKPAFLLEHDEKTQKRIMGLLCHSSPWFNYYGRVGSAALMQQAADMFVITVEQAKEVSAWLYFEEPAGEEPAGEEPAGEEPAGEELAFEEPAESKRPRV